MAYHLKLILKSGKDNLKLYPKAATSGIWTKGDLVTLDSTGKVDPKTAAGTAVANLETAILGVADSTETTDANAETNNVHVAVSVITPEQVWSIHVADGSLATDYEIGVGYKIGYFGGTVTDYNVGTSGGTDTIEVDECYYLVDSAATTAQGATVVGYPNNGTGEDAEYGGRVLIRFNPLACMGITG